MQTKYIRSLLTSLVLLQFSVAKAQDPHFSQYFASPLTLNPAMTGYFDGDHRVSANFRQQWWALGDPFITNTISYDTKLMQTKIPEHDVFGVGAMALLDQSLGGSFNSINVAASFSYHKALDVYGENNIGIGFQVTYATRKINLGGIDFASQFNGSGFDTRIPSNEHFDRNRNSYADINAGLMYRYKTESTEFYAAGSVYHLARPNTSFFSDQEFRLPMRYTLHAGSRFDVGTNGNELFLSGIYMYQAGASEKNIGLAYGISVSESASVYAGSWYRFGEAILPYIGLDHKNFQLGITYDVIVGGMKKYSPKNGSFELSANLLIHPRLNVYTNYKGGRIF